jgi:hypothetical protein
MAGQAYRAVEPSLLFVLHIRELAPVSKSDVKVTLSSGAVIRVRSSDVTDVRLTFLRTALAEARSRAASVGSAQSACAPSSESAQATKPATSATSAHETSERSAPTGAEQPAQAGAPPPGVEIQGDPANADTAKADFDLEPWTRRFIAEIRRCWFVPYAVLSKQGHVRLKFLLQKDGTITGLTVDESSVTGVERIRARRRHRSESHGTASARVPFAADNCLCDVSLAAGLNRAEMMPAAANPASTPRLR